jgi:uncharacterized protein
MNDLIEAIQKSDIERVKKLIITDPGLYQMKDENGLGCVSLAIYHHEPEIARLLIESGAPVTFFEHCALGDIIGVKRELQQNPALLDQFSVDGFQGLGLASFFGQVEVAEYLIKAGAKLNTPSNNSMHVQPLHSAVAAHHMHISEMLLEAGADVNAVQQDDYTPLHVAAANGQMEMVQLLLCFGARKDVHLENGRTPLDLACGNDHPEIVALLEE